MNLSAHYRSLIHIGLPIIIGQLGLIILGFADTFMIGWHSTSELAAAGFVNNLFTLAIIFSTGFTYGLTPLIGSYAGQGDKVQCSLALHNSFYANSLMACFVCAGLTILYACLGRLGQPVELLPLMRPYFIVLLASIPFVLWFNGLKQFTDGLADTQVGMWILLGGNVFNILGNYVLIYGHWGLPEWGLLGAGIATLAARILMVVIFIAVLRYHPSYRPYTTLLCSNGYQTAMFARLYRLGFPIALQMGMETASFSLSTVMVGWLGALPLAAHQVMLTVSQLCFMMYYGMGAAVSVRVSHFMGKGDTVNLQRTVRAGFHLILALLLLTCIPLFMLRHSIGPWFTDSREVSELVSGLLFPFILYQWGDGLQINYANALRGIADVKWMMIYAFIAYFIISLPAGYFFGFILDWGLKGIWMAFPFGLTTAGLLYYLRFRHRIKTIL